MDRVIIERHIKYRDYLDGKGNKGSNGRYNFLVCYTNSEGIIKFSCRSYEHSFTTSIFYDYKEETD